MKRLLLYAGILFSGTWCSGQMITPSVIASSGDFFFNSNAATSLSFTLGEMTMVETFQANSHFLTQGFHQPWEAVVSLEDEFVEEFVLYPNPAWENINLRCQLSIQGEITLRILSLSGTQVSPPRQLSYSGGLLTDAISISDLADGLYLLEVTFDSPRSGIRKTEYHRFNILKN